MVHGNIPINYIQTNDTTLTTNILLHLYFSQNFNFD